jgi:methionyl-tRNA formyltransferase
MQMDEGLDTGPMLFKAECPIGPQDTSEVLHDRLASLGAGALLATLKNLSSLIPDIQDNQFATYAKKITKEEALIDWRVPAYELALKVRAFNPWPVAFTTNNIRIWEARVIEENVETYIPGTIVHASSDGIDVATGQYILRLLKIQLPGGRVLPVADMLNSRHRDFSVGTLLS